MQEVESSNLFGSSHPKPRRFQGLERPAGGRQSGLRRKTLAVSERAPFRCVAYASASSISHPYSLVSTMTRPLPGEDPAGQERHETVEGRLRHHERHLLQQLGERRYKSHCEPPCSRRWSPFTSSESPRRLVFIYPEVILMASKRARVELSRQLDGSKQVVPRKFERRL